MWLRDSANQMQSYLALLSNDTNASDSSNDTIASLYRGVINLQSRYLLSNPYCNSFQPPSESGLPPSVNSAATNDAVTPSYSNTTVYECKYELDSLAAFLEISTDYYTATNDLAFFSKYNWVSAIQAVVNTAQSMTTPTYATDGSVNTLPYTFQRLTTTAEDTLDNKGTGNPVRNGTGLVRSAFRPSDDACIYEFLIPANMLFAHHLNTTSAILTAATGDTTTSLANEMTALSASLASSIAQHGIVSDPAHGDIYAYEIDGYGGTNIMDDANIPSLLSAPLIGYLAPNDPVYQSTRALLLSDRNPYFMRGSVINAIGGPHDGPGYAWPMASIVRAFTSGDEGEVVGELKALVGSTDGLGGWIAVFSSLLPAFFSSFSSSSSFSLHTTIVNISTDLCPLPLFRQDSSTKASTRSTNRIIRGPGELASPVPSPLSFLSPDPLALIILTSDSHPPGSHGPTASSAN